MWLSSKWRYTLSLSPLIELPTDIKNVVFRSCKRPPKQPYGLLSRCTGCCEINLWQPNSASQRGLINYCDVARSDWLYRVKGGFLLPVRLSVAFFVMSCVITFKCSASGRIGSYSSFLAIFRPFLWWLRFFNQTLVIVICCISLFFNIKLIVFFWWNWQKKLEKSRKRDYNYLYQVRGNFKSSSIYQ